MLIICNHKNQENRTYLTYLSNISMVIYFWFVFKCNEIICDSLYYIVQRKNIVVLVGMYSLNTILIHKCLCKIWQMWFRIVLIDYYYLFDYYIKCTLALILIIFHVKLKILIRFFKVASELVPIEPYKKHSEWDKDKTNR